MPVPCYTDPMDKEFVIMYQENQIHIQKAEHEFLLESSLASLYTSSSLFLESDPYDMEFDDDDSDEEEEKKDGKKVGIFTKICNAIKSFINSFITMIRNLFKDSLDEDTYMQSKAFDMRYDQDVERLTNEVNREMVKGRKIIQAISNQTHVDDVTVANFCDMGANLAIQNKKQIVNYTKGMLIKKKVLDSMDKSKKIVEDSQKNLEGKKLSKEETEKGVKVLNTMNKMVTTLGKSSKGFFQMLRNSKGGKS